MLGTVRLFFVVAGVSAGYLIGITSWTPTVKAGLIGACLGLVVSSLVILLEAKIKPVSVRGLSAAVFGLLFGLILSLIISFFIRLIPIDPELDTSLRIVITLILCYLGTVTAMRGKDEFNIIIPYVRLRREDQPEENIVLDTSAIIDGRIVDICKTKFISGRLVIPRFVLRELQQIADSQDALKRNRGKRGLDILHSLQGDVRVEVKIHEEDFEDNLGVDAKLVRLAKLINAKILTTDFNLNRVAELQGVKVLNINELANALRPVFLPGEQLGVKLVKEGKEHNQAVAYLDDGTMVVVEQAGRLIGHTVKATVTSVLQTQAGRMIFAKLNHYNESRRRR
jgi:uncharacterized protein YacL